MRNFLFGFQYSLLPNNFCDAELRALIRVKLLGVEPFTFRGQGEQLYGQLWQALPGQSGVPGNDG
ncbi:hypothetical protein ES703_83002 [subsurface metagenome]